MYPQTAEKKSSPMSLFTNWTCGSLKSAESQTHWLTLTDAEIKYNYIISADYKLAENESINARASCDALWNSIYDITKENLHAKTFIAKVTRKENKHKMRKWSTNDIKIKRCKKDIPSLKNSLKKVLQKHQEQSHIM